MTGLKYQILIDASATGRDRIDTKRIGAASRHEELEWIAFLRSSVQSLRNEFLRAIDHRDGGEDDDRELLMAYVELDSLLTQFVIDHGDADFADGHAVLLGADRLCVVLTWAGGPPAVVVRDALEPKLNRAAYGTPLSIDCTLYRWHSRIEIEHLVTAIARSWGVAAPVYCERVVGMRSSRYSVFTLSEAWDRAEVQGRPLGEQLSEALDARLADGWAVDRVRDALAVPRPKPDELKPLLFSGDASLRLAAIQLLERVAGA